MADFNAALRLRPGFARALGNRAVAHDHLDMYDEAEQDYLAAIGAYVVGDPVSRELRASLARLKDRRPADQ